MATNQITGTVNNDILLDTVVDDEIFALAGNDKIETSSDSDIVHGDAGTDTLTFNYGDRNGDLEINLSNYDSATGDGLVYIQGYNPYFGNNVSFYSIEKLKLIGGDGNDSLGSYAYNNIDSDETIVGGAGDDYISTGQGSDVVDGGRGYDFLDLNFANSSSGVASNLSSNNSGEYVTNNNFVEFSNIEAVGIQGSSYNDVLVIPAEKSNGAYSISMPYIYGGDGFDEIVVDLSSSNEDLYIEDSAGLRISPDYINDLSTDSIESYNITSGRGNDEIRLEEYYGGYTSRDDVVDAGAGNDTISTAYGYDIIDGGSGYDILNLGYSLSYYSPSRITSSLSDSNSGEYISNEGTVEFTNIEAVNVYGSYEDDILAIPIGDNNPTGYIPFVDGGDGFDELVVNLSDRNSDLNFYFNSNYYDFNGDDVSVSGNLDISQLNNPTSNETINFNNIESFNFTGGRGDDNLDLGYNNVSDDTVNAGAGNDYISTGQGSDVVDGGSGIDLLNLDFSNVFGGVTSNFTSSNSGEYVGGDIVTDFKNIEAFNVFGSQYDDVLIARGVDNSTSNLTNFTPPFIDGNSGYDELVVDYSDRNSDLNFSFNSNYYDFNGDDVSVSGNLNISQLNNPTLNETINFNNIESFNFTGGRGDDNLDLGYDNISDDTVNAGRGNDNIFTGKGSDVVDGGSGYDILNLDFYNSVSGVTSSLRDRHSGEYSSSDSSVEFSNIEALNVFGSSYDDVLVATTANSNNISDPAFPLPIIDGREGYDELVVDYSDRNSDLNININSSTYYQDGNNTSVSGNLDASVINNPTDLESINFGNIEGFDISAGRGDDNIELGYDNISDDTVDAGAGNDYIFTGKGSDVVDGGSGYDILNLDFYNSVSGVTSSFNDRNGGEYMSDEGAIGNSLIEFSNIEALNVQGSQYDDVLIAIANLSNQGVNSTGIPTTSYINGGLGVDKLVVDYSNSDSNLDIVNVNGYGANSGALSVFSPEDGNQNQIDFNDIESFNITTGAGNNNIDLGYENLSNDLIDAGAGNDSIFTGKGSDVVDGGSGYDTLNLDFSNSNNGITSSLSTSNSGKYISDESSIEFKNIEAINVTGSSYDDVLIATADKLNSEIDPTFAANSFVNGGLGLDELVIDVSNLAVDSDIYVNRDSDTSGSINIYSPETGDRTLLQFNDIEVITMTSNDGSETLI